MTVRQMGPGPPLTSGRRPGQLDPLEIKEDVWQPDDQIPVKNSRGFGGFPKENRDTTRTKGRSSHDLVQWLGNHGDRKSPKDRIVSLINALFMAYKCGLLTTY